MTFTVKSTEQINGLLQKQVAKKGKCYLLVLCVNIWRSFIFPANGYFVCLNGVLIIFLKDFKTIERTIFTLNVRQREPQSNIDFKWVLNNNQNNSQNICSAYTKITVHKVCPKVKNHLHIVKHHML